MFVNKVYICSFGFFLRMEEYKEKTLKSYAANAQYHQAKFKRLFDLERRREFQEFVNLIHGKKVLDVGCGTGEHTVYFQSKGLEVVAIDLSPEMVEIACKNGVNAKIMDLENLDFPSSSFDGIWAVTSLLHIPKSKITSILEKIASILVPGGILFISMIEGKGEGFVNDASDTSRYFAFYTDEELISLLSSYFELVDFWKDKAENHNFIQGFFRVKKSL